MTRQWSKRETQIVSVIESTVWIVGDLQAIAGKAMPEIPSLDVPLLEAASEPERKAGIVSCPNRTSSIDQSERQSRVKTHGADSRRICLNVSISC